MQTEPVAEWYERWRCDHSEAVRAGSKPGACKELLVLGKKLAWAGASGIREMRREFRIDSLLVGLPIFPSSVSRRHEVNA
jgi:hypothetical protein